MAATSAPPLSAPLGRGRGFPGPARRLSERPYLLLGLPLVLFLVLFMLVPLGTAIYTSFLTATPGSGFANPPLTLENYAKILGDGFYWGVFWSTLQLSAGVMAGCLVLGYPLAWCIARANPVMRPILMAVVLAPLLTNVVVRTIGVMILLADGGLINSSLLTIGLIGAPIQLLNTPLGVGIALVQVFMPFMVLALLDTLQSLDPAVERAAANLGAGPSRTFFSVTLPLSLPGILAGSLLVLLHALSAYVSATLVGGRKVWVMGILVYQQVLMILNTPLGTALAILMLLVTLAFVVGLSVLTARMTRRTGGRPLPTGGLDLDALFARSGIWPLLDIIGPWLRRALIGLALFVLLAPLLMVVVNSVNDVSLASIAGFRGFTLRWYAAVFEAGHYTNSFFTSVQLGVVSMFLALVLGTLGAVAITRQDFPGRNLLRSFYLLPMTIPGVVTAVGLLRLIRLIGLQSSFESLVIAHVVIATPYVVTLVAASLEQSDRRQEEAARNLGANAFQTFWYVTLPAIRPGLVAASIFAFIVSFEEVTVTAFLIGGRLMTLPVRIYSESQFALEPTISAISTLLVLLSVAVLLLLARFVRLDKFWVR